MKRIDRVLADEKCNRRLIALLTGRNAPTRPTTYTFEVNGEQIEVEIGLMRKVNGHLVKVEA